MCSKCNEGEINKLIGVCELCGHAGSRLDSNSLPTGEFESPFSKKDPIEQRRLRFKLFVGSTTEEIETDVQTFCESLCPGNLIASRLYRLGGVYQFAVWYAELTE